MINSDPIIKYPPQRTGNVDQDRKIDSTTGGCQAACVPQCPTYCSKELCDEYGPSVVRDRYKCVSCLCPQLP
jgi:hypothetical protein